MSSTSPDAYFNDTIILPIAKPEQSAQDPSAVTVFQIASLGVILASAFVGNGVIFVIFAKKPSLLSVSNRFVLHLAMCNFLMSVAVMPPVLASVVSVNWTLTAPGCAATGFLSVLLFAAIILTLVTITVDRYIAVMLPLVYYTYMTSNRAAVMISAVWLTAVTFALPPMLGWNVITYHPHRFICTAAVPSGDEKTTGNGGYYIFLMLGCFVIPLLAIVFMYGRMYFAARNLLARDRHRWFGIPSSGTTTSGFNSAIPITGRSRSFTSNGIRKIIHIHIGDEWRTAQTTLMVMFSFVISWLPYHVVGFVEAVMGRHVNPFWEWIPLWLAFSSCAFNPYVYVFRSASMRHHALSLVGLYRRS